MKFTNHTKGPKGLNALDGSLVYVDPGQTIDIEISEAEAKAAKATGWFSEGGEEPAPPATKPPLLKAEHHGGGKFNITRGEEVLQSGLSKADADAFNALSDEDKAAFVQPAA